MTRVLALVTDAFGGQGGIARATQDLIGAMATQNTISAIEVLPRHVPAPVADLPEKVRQAMPSPGRLSYAVGAIAAAIRMRPDIVFCNHLFMAPLAALMARLCGAKLMIQLHGIEIWKAPSMAQRSALERADLLLCVSRDTRARVLNFCDSVPERAVVINNTFDARFTQGDRTAARAKHGLDEEFVLLIVGRMDGRERYKGHDRVIEALPKLTSRDGRRVVFLVAGDGNDRRRLEDLAAAAGVSDRVRFIGEVLPVSLPDLYRSADLFVMPSTGEGFGIVFLEAMACGTRALGLAAGGAPDALGDGELGILVDMQADFPAALQAAIQSGDGDREELSSIIQERFGQTAFRRRVAQAIEMLQ